MKAKKSPCKECPYLKDSLPGWLGEAFGRPAIFLVQLDSPNLHPCHKEVDWEDKKNLKESISAASVCTGALQFMNNSYKLSRYPIIKELQEEAGENKLVFRRTNEFIEHHTL